MHWKRKVVFTVIALSLVGSFMTAQDKPIKDTQREADQSAIDRLTKDLIQAFDRRDAAAIAAHWTEEGEFFREDGEPIRGRTAIQQGYARFFQTLQGRPKLEVQMDTVRFPSADMAVSEVTLRVKKETGELEASAHQGIVLVRESRQWKVAVIREWDRDVGHDLSLRDLDWLIGTWHAATTEREVTIHYEWDENKSFIRGSFTVKEGAKAIQSGTEIIGKDNSEGMIRSWVFQSDGGFGSGAWARDGKKWTIHVHGVKADGSTLLAGIIYLQLDPNIITWQVVN
jgi:uncharacterized protein (TIGR02246 family)